VGVETIDRRPNIVGHKARVTFRHLDGGVSEQFSLTASGVQRQPNQIRHVLCLRLAPGLPQQTRHLFPREPSHATLELAQLASMWRDNLDEMTGVQAPERAAATLPVRPGLVLWRDYEYIRHRILTLSAALDAAAGRVSYHHGPARTQHDFASWLEALRAQRNSST
jgi:acetyl esterase/lipase